MLRRVMLGALVVLIGGCDWLRTHTQDPTTLSGTAEDLWGEKLDLGRMNRGLVLLHPFSPSNCGYCLFDGPFVRENFLRRAADRGGRVFHQSLFNPQRDNYTFLKHERDTTTPVLTFPPALHRYHRDGFPFLTAFRDGRILCSKPLSPYPETARELAGLLWPGADSTLTLTSPLHMAARFVFENQHDLAVIVVPDGDAAAMASWEKSAQNWRGHPADVKFEGQLTAEDRRRSLYYAGSLTRFRFQALAGASLPFGLSREEVRFGEHRFATGEVELSACFPNPFARERYVVFEGRVWHNDVDFTLCRRGSAAGRPEVVLEGFFAKRPDGRWLYADSLAWGAAPRDEGCGRGICEAPVSGPGADPPRHSSDEVTPWETTEAGLLRRLGDRASRFPSLAVDGTGACWVAWEERGDVRLARADGSAAQAPLAADAGLADSFDPVLAAAGSHVWVVFLEEQDGFYRVVARSAGGDGLGPAIPVSATGPYDAITPAAAADSHGRLVVAWSDWRANFRHLRFRNLAIDSRTGGVRLDSVRTAVTCKSDIDYVNAWYASLAIDANGGLWAAWNQHYPATLGVCAGNLTGAARSVTRLGTKNAPGEGEENGGYPSLAIDGGGKRWVVWESFGWDVLQGEPQRICAASFDTTAGGWIPEGGPARTAGTFFNQTPRAAVDPAGDLWVVWSGRDREGSRPWSVYLARRTGGEWSRAERLSPAGTNARAPVLAIGRDGRVWVAWHAGIGDKMRIEVLQYRRSPGGNA